ncbi:hypothetical protein M3595_08545 [Staphylococcus warneri]|uniref:Lipoprotein n=2 Tax=Staphylococcus warneri TaxID=1292 RepID=A0A364UT44_STAWA|nr:MULTISPECIES: hypothetical protein [Staphylococcus]AGC89462.1 hypothetical protein A284_00655 [Staphylococcus warneri SG1]MBJ7886317.1 hypothetical protein [Bacillaceae bacterium HSR45]PAK71995.1 hypothetical protein B8W95_12005 [Staphylococcus pasteuri]COS55046.1 Uncharacterised protein [Streptococcus pneumoniae]EGG95647.1 conserved domain protein [Staphylococcus warneri VCU121]
MKKILFLLVLSLVVLCGCGNSAEKKLEGHWYNETFEENWAIIKDGKMEQRDTRNEMENIKERGDSVSFDIYDSKNDVTQHFTFKFDKDNPDKAKVTLSAENVISIQIDAVKKDSSSSSITSWLTRICIVIALIWFIYTIYSIKKNTNSKNRVE